MSAALHIGLLVFPKVTQLDFTGPLQVLSRVPGATVHLIWTRIEPVSSDTVLTITPTTTFADCPQLDVICVPGGAGADDMVNDEEVLQFLRQQSKAAKYVTSVCTGSLVLGAAGLLRAVVDREGHHARVNDLTRGRGRHGGRELNLLRVGRVERGRSGARGDTGGVADIR